MITDTNPHRTCGFCIKYQADATKWEMGITTVLYVPICDKHKLLFEQIGYGRGDSSWRVSAKAIVNLEMSPGQLNMHRLEGGASPVCSTIACCEYQKDDTCVFCGKTHDETWSECDFVDYDGTIHIGVPSRGEEE